MRSVAIVVINFNGLADLPGCLEAVEAQTFPGIDLVIIDNHSTDGSREWLRGWVGEAGTRGRFAARPPALIENAHNAGFSPALNQGIRATTSDLVMPLNTDVVLREDFVEVLAACFGDQGVGSASGKLLRFPVGGVSNKIDSVGHVIFRNRLAWNLGEGLPGDREFLEKAEVWGTCGAAAVYSREMLEDVAVEGEFFDEDFFAFWEDLDLDWRARMRGWRCVMDPAALAWHRRGGAGYRKSLLVERHNLKNRHLMMLKNDQARFVLRNLPGMLTVEVLKAAALLVRCPRALGAYLDVVRLAPSMLVKRRSIQSRRLVPAGELESWFAPFHYKKWFRRHLLNRGGMIEGAEG